MNASQNIDKRIKELADWRGKYVAELRKIILEASSEIKEDWKWGSPVYVANGLICSIGSFKDHVKLHFFKGASLKGLEKFFNTGFEAKETRGVNYFENDPIDKKAITEAISEAVSFNTKK